MFDKNNLRKAVKNYNLNDKKANSLIKTGMLYEPKETLALIREIQEETFNPILKFSLLVAEEKILINKTFIKFKAANYKWSLPYLAYELGIPRYSQAMRIHAFDLTLSLETNLNILSLMEEYKGSKLRKVDVNERKVPNRSELEASVRKSYTKLTGVDINNLLKAGVKQYSLRHMENGDIHAIKENDLLMIFSLL